MKAVVKSTGEVIEFEPQTYHDYMDAWLLCSEYEKAYKSLKDKLKPAIQLLVGPAGTTEPYNGHLFRVSTIQRMNYDKTILRDALDEDTFDLLLEPNKTAVDNYLKEHLEEMGDKSHQLRETMVPVGRPYTVIKAEKVERS